MIARPPGATGLDLADTRRTLWAYAACCLGILPLCAMFTNRIWVGDVWISMLVVVGPAALLRLRWAPRVWQTWVGLGALVLWLTARYLSRYAVFGVLPGRGSWHDLQRYLDDLHRTTATTAAPIHSTLAVTLMLSAVTGLMAALVDLLAVVGRHGALAGVPFLVVFTVAGAVTREPVHWVWFIAAAVGFMILLSLDARDTVRHWGRLIPRQGEARPNAVLAVSGQRIALIAVIAALAVPLLAPSRARNLIADTFHNGHSSGDGPAGFGAGHVSIDPFVALKGELIQPKAINLFTVKVDPAQGVVPFYLRTNILATATASGWRSGDHGAVDSLDAIGSDLDPADTAFPGPQYVAKVTISGLGGNPPVFSRPTSVQGLPGATRWTPRDQLLVGSDMQHGDSYTESVSQPTPSVAELEQAPSADPGALAQWLQVPDSMPRVVVDLVARLTAGATSDYAKVRAISDYFTNPANGFTYSLSTRPGTSGNDLVDFLTNKTGFCQQYAGAMGIMVRLAGVPARVVLGYTHAPPDSSGQFVVTTNNAHAWVEANFPGLGWIPFDPTPDAGLAGGSKSVLAWAPHPVSTSTGLPRGGTGAPSATSTKRAGIQGQDTATAGNQHRHSVASWPLTLITILLVVMACLAVVPASARWLRRRRRLREARSGDPDPLWAELSDTAVDLGYVWSSARTPRQVVHWLNRQAGPGNAAALQNLAAAVEQSRYAPPATRGAPVTTLTHDLRTVEAQLRERRSWRMRLRARLLPESLGWRLPKAGRRR